MLSIVYTIFIPGINHNIRLSPVKAGGKSLSGVVNLDIELLKAVEAMLSIRSTV